MTVRGSVGAVTTWLMLSVLAGCAGAASTQREATPMSTGAGSAESPTEILDFSAPRLGGGTIEGSDYAGHDLAIWFWAPW
jgi:hypothetical protein